MKTLKLTHESAELIRSGTKTSTWRIYDDKDLRVNDEVQFIDKVDPHDRSTWVPVGVANIDSVNEKRLRNITADDMEGHEKFDSQEAMLQAYQAYYGPDVSLDTPVKIIRFSLSPVTALEDEVAENTTKITEIKMYADGGSRGNPGPSATGYVLLDMDDNILFKQGAYLGITTNNQAEYLAVKHGLEQAQKLGARIVHVHLDSLLVVNQMLGKFKVKNRDLWPIHKSVKDLVEKFEKVTFVHVPRALNKLADGEVNEVLDREAKNNYPDKVV